METNIGDALTKGLTCRLVVGPQTRCPPHSIVKRSLYFADFGILLILACLHIRVRCFLPSGAAITLRSTGS